MPRITKVTTRTGDDGTTGLGNGARVPKSAPRIQAYGTVDELNAAIGVVLALHAVTAGDPEGRGGAPRGAPSTGARGLLPPELARPLAQIQNDLFHVGADLCVPEGDKAARPGPRIEARHLSALDELIADLNSRLPALQNFVLPGGDPHAAFLHVARTICRRAEREVVALGALEPINALVVQYLNRLSDALFVMSRYQNQAVGAAEPVWDSRA